MRNLNVGGAQLILAAELALQSEELLPVEHPVARL